jgi:tetratricopeptide (TPR) repeat protein
MNIERLKEKARSHEQQEQWQKALELYQEALRKQPDDRPSDISLFNRVGDLQTRLGRFDEAAGHFEMAIGLYLEAELPNNAIAVCKKVLRNLPDRHGFLLRLGKIRAEQGFLVDARHGFLDYAERRMSVGDTEGALDALVEFVALAPDDVEIRLALASQLEVHHRVSEAVAQYEEAYRRLILQERGEEAETVSQKLEELAPDLELPTPQAIRDDAPLQSPASDGGFEPTSLADIELAEEDAVDSPVGLPGQEELQVEGEELQAEEEELQAEGGEAGLEEEEPHPTAPGAPMEDLEFTSHRWEEEEEVPPPLPLLDGDEYEEVPAGDTGSGRIEEGDGSLPLLDSADEIYPAEEAREAALEESASEPSLEDHHEAAEQGDLPGAIELVQAAILSRPRDLELRQRLVEYAFRISDEPLLASAYLGLAECLLEAGETGKARAVFRQVLSLDPGDAQARARIRELGGPAEIPEPTEVASSEEYVDLGALILGEEREKTTRWRVTTEGPSGDDAADFAKMLGQFKEKVSEHLAVDDVAAHYDLGTAYMEMGLFDEAISEFQMALRASPGHLATHEVMGRCWMEMNKPEMAVRGLRRALEVAPGIEDELIGIYYLMGRAQESLGNTGEAAEFYEKVFSLDINFEDVTERLRALR